MAEEEGTNRDITEKGKLLKLILDSFNLDELETLAFNIGIVWELLSGDTLPKKGISLINYACRHNLLDPLQEQLKLARDAEDWDSIDWSSINEQMPISKDDKDGFAFNLGCSWQNFSIAINVASIFLIGILSISYLSEAELNSAEANATRAAQAEAEVELNSVEANATRAVQAEAEAELNSAEANATRAAEALATAVESERKSTLTPIASEQIDTSTPVGNLCADGFTPYIPEAGETLSSISRKFQITLAEIIIANPDYSNAIATSICIPSSTFIPALTATVLPPTQILTPSPSATLTPSSTPSLTPTPSPSSTPTMAPTPEPTSESDPRINLQWQTLVLVLAIASIIIINGVNLYFWWRTRRTFA